MKKGNRHELHHLGEEEQVRRLDEKGWKADAVSSYTFIKYELNGDKLVAYFVLDTKRAQPECLPS